MSLQNPVVAEVVVNPIDRTATNPSISFGGDEINNSGTGIYGTYGQINVSISGSSQLQIDANGVSLGASGVIILTGAGTPVDGTTGLNFAGIGSLYVDVTNGILYINQDVAATPAWVLVGPQP